MVIEQMVKEVTQMLEKEGNSKAVFGDLVKLESHSIVPVAVIEVAGAGAGAGGQPAKPGAFIGGGGGMGFKIRPVGFIQERHGEVVFSPIHLDVQHKPFLNEASAGLGKAIDTVLGLVSSAATRLLDRPTARPPVPATVARHAPPPRA